MGATYFWYYRHFNIKCSLMAGGVIYETTVGNTYEGFTESPNIPQVTVKYNNGVTPSPSSIFSGTYNYTEIAKNITWNYYKDSACTQPISRLNTIYWGTGDSSKWGGSNNGLKVSQYYLPNSYWASVPPDGWSWTFKASTDVTATKNVSATVNSYLVSNNKFVKTVYITFPNNTEFHNLVPGYEGRTLKGWKCHKNSYAYGGNTYSPGQKVTVGSPGTYYFYPEFENNTYTISFNGNGATSGPKPSSISITYGGTCVNEVNAIKVSKTGYTFDGWYTAKTGGTKFDPSVPYASTTDLNLFAHWKQDNFTITIDSNGGKFDSNSASDWTINSGKTKATKTFQSGSKIGTFPSVSKEVDGVTYVLTGFFTSNSGGTEVTVSDTVTSSKTIYAQWETSSWTLIYFDCNGGIKKGDPYKDPPFLGGPYEWLDNVPGNGLVSKFYRRTQVNSNANYAFNGPTKPGYILDGFWTKKADGSWGEQVYESLSLQRCYAKEGTYWSGSGTSAKWNVGGITLTLYARWKPACFFVNWPDWYNDAKKYNSDNYGISLNSNYNTDSNLTAPGWIPVLEVWYCKGGTSWAKVGEETKTNDDAGGPALDVFYKTSNSWTHGWLGNGK